MKDYRANAESMGDGWNNADEAAKLWNKYILPILQEATNYDECDPEPPTVSVGHGRAAYADDWAWEEFCAREAGDDEDICIALAEELSEKLGQQEDAMKKNTEHLNNLLTAAVEADRRNDAAARNRCEFEAVTQYALCSRTTWGKKFKAMAA